MPRAARLRLTTTAVAALALNGSLAATPRPQEPTLTDRQDALQLLQGSSTDGTLDPARIAQVEAWITKIRAAHPEVAKLHAHPRNELGAALLFFAAESARVLDKAEWKVESGRLLLQGSSGIQALDELNAALHARLHRAGLPGSGFRGAGEIWIARFAETLDAPTLCRRYQALAAIETAEPNCYGGDGDDIFLKQRGARLLFVFKRGWGDCMAGCIHNHYHYFEVDTAAGTVEKKGELKSEDSRSGRIHRWGVPARFAVAPFDDLDAVLRASAHDDWWVVLHAVEVVGTMLAGSKTPWLGEDFQFQGRFGRVRDGIAARPDDAHRMLVLALVHDDPDVRESALRHLRAVSKLDHGGDADGVRAWHAWLEKQGFDK